MPGSKRAVVMWVAGGMVVAVLVGAGAGWLIRSRDVSRLEGRVARLEAAAETTSSAETTGSAESTWVVTTSPSSAIEDSGGNAASDAPREESSAANETQPAFVRAISNNGDVWTLQVDYVQFLMGGEAADAATAHGAESPPPNGYYVVNDNPKLRVFPIQAGIGVVVVTNSDGTSEPSGRALTLSQWAAEMTGPHAAVFSSTIYWVTVTNGTVTAINAQYTP